MCHENRSLFLGERNVSDPTTHGRLGDTETPRDDLHGKSFIAAQSARFLALSVFITDNSLSSKPDGNKRAARIELAYPGWKPGALPLSYARPVRVA
jgi:hypothetical protein